MTPEQVETAKALRAEGKTYDAIGEALGVNASTVQYWLKPAFRAYCLKRDKAKYHNDPKRRERKNARARELYRERK